VWRDEPEEGALKVVETTRKWQNAMGRDVLMMMQRSQANLLPIASVAVFICQR
jgi:hypothetical protein